MNKIRFSLPESKSMVGQGCCEGERLYMGVAFGGGIRLATFQAVHAQYVKHLDNK